MAKYKVGDKVKIKDDLEVSADYECCIVVSYMLPFRGQTVTISGIDYYGCYRIEEDKKRWAWTDEMFEGLAPETFKLSDIEFADVITFRNGNRCVYTYGHVFTEDKYDGFDECELAEYFTENLKCCYGDDDDYDYDIVKVERAGQVVYERNENVLEVTMEEVAEKFGVDNIKITKDKEN